MTRVFSSKVIADQFAVGDAFLVAGMHRSGTSAFARVCALLGAELPRTLMQPGADNPKGFWESAPIAALNDALLAEMDTAWDDVLAFLIRPESGAMSYAARLDQLLASEFSLKRSIVLKDPRVAILLDPWMAALTRHRLTPRVIIPIRNPIEVCASLAERNNFSHGRSLLLWLAYFLSIEKASRSRPRMFVQYDDMLEDWRGVMRRLEARFETSLPSWTPTAEMEIDRFLSPSDRRHLVPPHLLQSRADIVHWVKQSYAWASAAAADGEEPPAEEIDAIAAEFGASLRVYGPLIAEQKRLISRGADRLTVAEAELSATSKKLSDQTDRSAALESELRARIDQLTQAELTAREAQAARDIEIRDRDAARDIEIRDRDLAIWALEGDLNQERERLEAYRQDVETLEPRLERQIELNQSQQAELQKLRSESIALDERLRGELSALNQRLQSETQELGARNDALKARVADLDANLSIADQRAEDLRLRGATLQAALLGAQQKLRSVVGKLDAKATELLGMQRVLRALEVHAEATEASLRGALEAKEANWRGVLEDKESNWRGVLEDKEATLRGARQDVRALEDQLLAKADEFGRFELDSRRRESAHQEHVKALEASIQAGAERLSAVAAQENRYRTLAETQRAFMLRSMPLARRIRRAVWSRPWLRPFSDSFEFARLALKHGPAKAARIVATASTLRGAEAFDLAFYLDNGWDVAASGRDPWIHYAETGAAEGRDPSAVFSTSQYLARNPDVAQAGANPLAHYVRHGREEGRSGVRRESAQSADAGGGVDLYAVRPDDDVPAEAGRGAAFVERYRLLGDDPDWAGAVAAINNQPLVAPDAATPDVSVIVPVYGQLAYTLNCLDALASHASKYSFEVIVVDDCSPDDTWTWLPRVRAVRAHKREQNGGFIEACNDGARQARGRWLVFLNNDTRVVRGWLDALIDSFASLNGAELVGSKLFYPDGSLQEAGGIIWRDGSAWNYGRNDDPARPEYCYARQVDYVSGASIAIERSTWREIGGFDERYKPAYAEDSDLALKIRYARDKGVWLQPLSRVIHYEGKTSGVDVTQGAKAHQVRNAKTLYETWKDALATHGVNGEKPHLEKDRGVTRRALVIDATTPEPDKDAGSVTCLELMRAMQGAGYGVSFVAADNLLFLPRATGQLQGLGIEVHYWPYLQSMQNLLEQRGHEFDVVVVFRFAVAEKLLPAIRANCPNARVIFHSSDLHFLREERHAGVDTAASAKETKSTRDRELSVINAADVTIVHSTFEAGLLREQAPRASVYVFPWILNPAGRQAPFAARSGVGFLGGYRHLPNVDAVEYFVERVWPLVRKRAPEMQFFVAGSECPESLRRLDGRDGVVVVGFVQDLDEFFAKIRLSVAPIRYGAGIKGKVAVSMAHGVPVVLTACAAEGMGVTDGKCVVIRDDAQAFADELVALYEDQHRWTNMSDAGLLFVEEQYGEKLARGRIEELLALASARKNQRSGLQ